MVELFVAGEGYGREQWLAQWLAGEGYQRVLASPGVQGFLFPHSLLEMGLRPLRTRNLRWWIPDSLL